MSTQQNGGLKPTRRTLVKGAAWSVPVVAMGASAAAADVVCSPNSCPIIFNSGASCKVASVPDFRFVFDTTLPAGTSVTVTSWTWTPNDDTHITEFGPITTSVTDSGQLVYVLEGTSSTNGNLQICFSWAGGGVPEGSDCINTQSNAFANCDGNPATYPQRSSGAGVSFDPPTLVYPATP